MTNSAASGPTPGKQVIYVDVDDEITAIIDKMNASSARVIALVLPKRATVLQSVVNMKLLKRRAEDGKKHLVLITSEAGLMPLAGMAGIHVAQTLQSKPEIPDVAGLSDAGDDDLDDEPVSLGDYNPRKDSATSVGTLASRQSGAGSLAGAADDVIDVDEAADGSLTAAGAAAPTLVGNKDDKGKKDKGPKPPKDSKLKVPDFLRFRKRLLFGVLGLIVLIGLWYVAYFILPKATIVIKTNASDVDTNLALTLDTTANQLDEDKLTVPAQTQQTQKTNTQQVAATGTENKGQKATGKVTFVNCSADGSPVTIPAGTGVSSNGLTFITQKTVELQTSTPNCKSFGGFTSGSADVVAQKAGAGYNVAAGTFTVAGISNVQATSSDPMSGGTDNNVKIVQQSDVDSAKQKLTSGMDANAIKNQLQQNLQHDGLTAISQTFNAGTPNVSTSVNVGDEADNVTVTETIGYTMYGVKKSDLQKLVDAQVNKKIDKQKQSIQDDGVDKANFTVPSPGSGAQLKVTMSATAMIGPHLNVDDLKKEIVGKKSGNVKDMIKSNPGVDDAEVTYSPFWVSKAPKPDKVTVTFEKTSKSSSND